MSKPGSIKIDGCKLKASSGSALEKVLIRFLKKRIKLASTRVIPGSIRVGIKKPTQKTHPKKPQKTHLKKPTKMFFFLIFLNFLFFMKIIQTFLFQPDFL